MKRSRSAKGYTLIEVLTSAVIIGLAISAAVSMSSTMVLQEELSWRTTVALNYQENAAKLWQMGMNPFEVEALMPSTAGNPMLGSVLAAAGTTTELGTFDPDGLGGVEMAAYTLQRNNVGSAGVSGASSTVGVYRPSTR